MDKQGSGSYEGVLNSKYGSACVRIARWGVKFVLMGFLIGVIALGIALTRGRVGVKAGYVDEKGEKEGYETIGGHNVADKGVGDVTKIGIKVKGKKEDCGPDVRDTCSLQ